MMRYKQFEPVVISEFNKAGVMASHFNLAKDYIGPYFKLKTIGRSSAIESTGASLGA